MSLDSELITLAIIGTPQVGIPIMMHEHLLEQPALEMLLLHPI